MSPFIGMFICPFALLSHRVTKTTENNTKYEAPTSLGQIDFSAEYPDLAGQT